MGCHPNSITSRNRMLNVSACVWCVWCGRGRVLAEQAAVERSAQRALWKNTRIDYGMKRKNYVAGRLDLWCAPKQASTGTSWITWTRLYALEMGIFSVQNHSVLTLPRAFGKAKKDYNWSTRLQATTTCKSVKSTRLTFEPTRGTVDWTIYSQN